MKNSFCLIAALFFFYMEGYGHGSIQGKVLDSDSKTPLASTFIRITNATNRITYAEEDGYFHFKHLDRGAYVLQFSALGYKTMTDTVEVSGEGITLVTIYLEEDMLELPEVEITPRGEFSQTTVSSLDFKMRPHNSTQDLLRVVPGLFIAQHAGGGKAEQLFLRGFDVDHGTDVAIAVDGMSVNMVSHAHGQGYADLHFVIPETIDNLSFSKGSYDSRSGNFHTAGAVKFKTKNYVRQNVLRYERGIFNTERGLAMINIIPGGNDENKKNSAYVAGEFFFSRLYFDAPQDLDRYNLFFKYNQAVTRHSDLSVSLSLPSAVHGMPPVRSRSGQ